MPYTQVYETKNRLYACPSVQAGHDNPSRGKWNLVTDVTEYIHSSARFYLCGEQDFYPVMNYLELNAIDLTEFVPD